MEIVIIGVQSASEFSFVSISFTFKFTFIQPRLRKYIPVKYWIRFTRLTFCVKIFICVSIHYHNSYRGLCISCKKNKYEFTGRNNPPS